MLILRAQNSIIISKSQKGKDILQLKRNILYFPRLPHAHFSKNHLSVIILRATKRNWGNRCSGKNEENKDDTRVK